MKNFAFGFFALLLFFCFVSCESPRLVFPDLDYGVVIDSSDVKLYQSGKRDSLDLISPGDRIKAQDSIVILFSPTQELYFSSQATVKLFVERNLDFGDETIVNITDHYSISKINDSLVVRRSATKIIFASEKTQSISWHQK